MTAPIFSSDALRALRQLNQGSLTSRARIDARVRTSGPGGANAGGLRWATVDGGAAVPCRLSPLVPAVGATAADQNVNIGRWLLVTDVDGPTITEGDRATVTGTDVAGNAWTRQVVVIGRHSPRTFSAMASWECRDAEPSERGDPSE